MSINWNVVKKTYDHEIDVPLAEGKNEIILITYINDEMEWTGPLLKSSVNSKGETNHYREIIFRLKDNKNLKRRNFFASKGNMYRYDFFLKAFMDYVKVDDQVKALQLKSEVRDDLGQVVQAGTAFPIWVAYTEGTEIDPKTGKPYRNINWYYTEESYNDREKPVQTEVNQELIDLNL
jgi:hypothetical protein